MPKPRIHNMYEMNMLALDYARKNGQHEVADYLDTIINFNSLTANLDPQLKNYMSGCLGRGSIRGVDDLFLKHYSIQVYNNLKDEYEFDREVNEEMSEKRPQYLNPAPNIAARAAAFNAYLHRRLPPAETIEAFADYASKFGLDPALDSEKLLDSAATFQIELGQYGKDFSDPGKYGSDVQYLLSNYNLLNDDKADVYSETFSDIPQTYPEKTLRKADLVITTGLSGYDLNLDNYKEELKDAKYDDWANSLFDRMFSNIYTPKELDAMRRQGLEPMKLMSISGKPLEEHIKESPLYDPNKSFKEQAARCTIRSMLDSEGTLEVRKLDPNTRFVSKPVKVETKAIIKERFNFKRFFNRLMNKLFGVKLKEPLEEEKLDRINKNEEEVTTDSIRRNLEYTDRIYGTDIVSENDRRHGVDLSTVINEHNAENNIDGVQHINTPAPHENAPQTKAEHTM